MLPTHQATTRQRAIFGVFIGAHQHLTDQGSNGEHPHRLTEPPIQRCSTPNPSYN